MALIFYILLPRNNFDKELHCFDITYLLPKNNSEKDLQRIVIA